MCCIFTCCGWMLDLLQRCWIFFMSCCISSAVCCVLITASTSGIALGYNYSLAEYIDLKETNISVYIKRGVFDDEIANDMEWRRAGHKPDISGFISDKNLRTATADNDTLKPSRRLDDSIYESDSQNKYEGSLMRLTARPPHQPGVVPVEPSPPFQPYTSPTTPGTSFTSFEKIHDIVQHYPPGSLDQLKAIQTVINARRAGQPRPQQLSQQNDARKSQGIKTYVNKYDDHFNDLENFPGFPSSGASGRKALPYDPNDRGMPSNIFRDAVPRGDLAGWPKNAVPKYPDPDYEEGRPPTFPPHPPTWSPSPIRPLKISTPVRTSVVEQRVPSRTPQRRPTPDVGREEFKDDLDKYKQRLLINQYDEANPKDEQERKKQDDPDYVDEFKGAPVRRKRSIINALQQQTYESEVNNENLIISTFSFGSEITQTTFITKSLTDVSENKQRSVDTAKQLSNSTVKTKQIHLINSTKKKRKNRRKKPRKHKKSKVNQDKRRRQKQQKSKIGRSATGSQKNLKRRTFEYLKQSSLLNSVADHNATSGKYENIIKPIIDGASNFMNKLSLFLSVNQTDGLSKNKTNTIPYAETSPITVSVMSS